MRFQGVAETCWACHFSWWKFQGARIGASFRKPGCGESGKDVERWGRPSNAGLCSEVFSHQELKMELKVKNLTLLDSRGCDLWKEVMVKVTNQRTQRVRLPGSVASAERDRERESERVSERAHCCSEAGGLPLSSPPA